MAMDLSPVESASANNCKRRTSPAATPTASHLSGVVMESKSEEGTTAHVSRGRKRQRVSVSEETNGLAQSVVGGVGLAHVPPNPAFSSSNALRLDAHAHGTAPTHPSSSSSNGLNGSKSSSGARSMSLSELPPLSARRNAPSVSLSKGAGGDEGGVIAPRGPLSPSEMKTFAYPSGFRSKRRKSVSAEVDTNYQAPYVKKFFPKSDEDLEQIRCAMRSIFLFQHIDADQQIEIENAFQELRVKSGHEVITEGADGDFFYVVKTGTYSVYKRVLPHQQLSSPEFDLSSAAVAAASSASAVSATRSRSRSRSPNSISSQFGARVRVSSSGSESSIASAASAAALSLQQQQSSSSSSMRDEDGDSVMESALETFAVPQRRPSSSGLGRRNSTSASSFRRKRFSAADVHVPVPEYQEIFKYSKPGNFFGELALMYHCPRAASVRATSDGVLWALNRATFKHILTEMNKERSRKYDQFVRNVRLFRKLSHAECSKIADCLIPETFQDGEVVIREGDEGQRFYIVEKGQAVATQRLDVAPPSQGTGADSGAPNSDANADAGVVVKQVGVANTGDYFGEKALMTNAPRAATITASGGPLKVSSMDRASFERLLGPLKAVMDRKIATYRSASELHMDQQQCSQ